MCFRGKHSEAFLKEGNAHICLGGKCAFIFRYKINREPHTSLRALGPTV